MRGDRAQSTLESLPQTWRDRAEVARSLAAEGAARALEFCASTLEEALKAQESELITLTEAAAISGFSADHLGRLVREGRIPNHGRPNAPRVRRAELPRKTHCTGSTCLTDPKEPVSSFSQIARAVVHRHAGGVDD